MVLETVTQMRGYRTFKAAAETNTLMISRRAGHRPQRLTNLLVNMI